MKEKVFKFHFNILALITGLLFIFALADNVENEDLSIFMERVGGYSYTCFYGCYSECYITALCSFDFSTISISDSR